MNTINSHNDSFTGKIIYPVVSRVDGGIRVNYRSGGRAPKSEEEDVSLAIEAHERRNETYDIWVMGRLRGQVTGFQNATDTMTGYIDLETGKLKGNLERSVLSDSILE
jgi:hypothetical protein